MFSSTSPTLPSTKYAEDTKKRTRVTPAQLTILEDTFKMTATPDSKLRKQLAERLKMPERSIQIWFQNRRAKVKMLQKRVMIQQQQTPNWSSQIKMPLQRAWSTDIVSTPLFTDPLQATAAYITPSPQPSLMKSLDQDLLPEGWITANSLTIGSWHRMKIHPQDLECTYQLTNRFFAWHIRDNEYHFKMVVSFNSLSMLELVLLDDPVSAQINFQLLEPPMFFMKSQTNWIRCSDFTEAWILNQFGLFYAKDYQWTFQQGRLHLHLSQIHYKQGKKKKKDYTRWIRSAGYRIVLFLLSYVRIHIQSFTFAHPSRLVYVDHIQIYRHARTLHLKAASARILEDAHRPWATAIGISIRAKKNTALHMDVTEVEIDASHLPTAHHGTQNRTATDLSVTVQSARLHFAGQETVFKSQSRQVQLILSYTTEFSAAQCKISDAHFSCFLNKQRLCQCELPGLEFHYAFADLGLKNMNLIMDSPTLFLEKALFNRSLFRGSTSNQKKKGSLLTFAWILSSPTVVFPTTDQGQFYLKSRHAVARILGEPGPPSRDFDDYFAQQEAYWLDRSRRHQIFKSCIHLVQHIPQVIHRDVYSIDLKWRLERFQVGCYTQKIQKQIVSVRSVVFRCSTRLDQNKQGCVVYQLTEDPHLDLSLEKCSIYLWQEVLQSWDSTQWLQSGQAQWKPRLSLDASNISVSVANEDPPVRVHMALHVHHLSVDTNLSQSLWTGISIEYRAGTEPVQSILSVSQINRLVNTLVVQNIQLTYSLAHHGAILVIANSLSRLFRNKSKHTLAWIITCNQACIEISSRWMAHIEGFHLSTFSKRTQWTTFKWLERHSEGWHPWACIVDGTFQKPDLTLNQIKIVVPFEAHLTPLFDGAINHLKAVKALYLKFGFSLSESSNAIKNIGSIKVKICRFVFQLLDDPFEVKLRRIFSVGFVEQAKRSAYRQAFDQKSWDLDESSEQVERAAQSLRAHFSSLWYKHISQNRIHEEQSFLPKPVHSSINLQPISQSAPLTQLSMESIYIHLESGRMSDPQSFMNQNGAGVPLNKQHSSLVPFHLSIASGQTRIKIRDYPLPLLYIPTSWQMETDGVLANELATDQGTRQISMNILPGYQITIIRAISSLKWYSNTQWAVSGLSYLNGSASYKPALRHIAQILCSLCPTSSDPSPPLGWWDKIRFAYHLRACVNFDHGLCLLMKGDSSPYTSQGFCQGIACVWKDNAKILLGQEKGTHYFKIVSSSFLAGVPLLDQSLPLATENLFSTLVCQLSGTFSVHLAFSFRKKGVSLGEPHLLSPHYQVVLTSTQGDETDVEKHDSFKKFRSNLSFISVDITHTKTASKDRNAVYLSPHFLDHYSKWKGIFKGPLSLRIRQGALWPLSASKFKKPKFPLSLVQYKITLDSLSLGLFCPNYDQNIVGLKMHSAQVVIDLHTVLPNRPEKSSTKTLCFIKDMDIRTVRASNDPEPEQNFPISSDFFIGSFLEPEKACHHWSDTEDFNIMESKQNYQNIKVYPFLFSPFIYLTKTDDEAFLTTHCTQTTHTCITDQITGTFIPLIYESNVYEFQKSYLQRRAKDMDGEIERLDRNMDTVKEALSQCNYNGYHELLAQQNSLSQKIKHLQKKRLLLYEYTCQVILEEELNIKALPIFHFSEWGTQIDSLRNRCIFYNPQVVLNTSVTDILSDWITAKQTHTEHTFNLSTRCLQFLWDHIQKQKINIPPPGTSSQLEDSDNFNSFISKEVKENLWVDAFYPQILMQSQDNHSLLLTSKRIQTQAYTVLDPISAVYIGHQYITDFSDSRFWIVQRPAIETREYGNNCAGHWATWLYPEQLWTYGSTLKFENFYNTTDSLSGIVQLDRHHSVNFDAARKANTVFKIDLNPVHWRVNSEQAHIVFQTLLLLLARHRNNKKEGLQERLKEMVVFAENNNFIDNFKHVQTLQYFTKNLVQIHYQYLASFSTLDVLGLKEFENNKKAMNDSFERLTLTLMAIRSVHRFMENMVIPSVQLVIVSKKVVWELMQDQEPLSRWKFTNIVYNLFCQYDGTRKNLLEIDDVEITDTTKAPLFSRVLYSTNSFEVPILRVVLVTALPVGGISVVKKLQITFASLNLQISTKFFTSLKEYFFPTIAIENDNSSNHKKKEILKSISGDNDVDTDSLSPVFADGQAESSSYKHILKKSKTIGTLGSLVKKVKKTILPNTSLYESTQHQKRPQRNISFISIVISGANHRVSLRGPYNSTLYNIIDFSFKQPNLQYVNKTWSLMKLTKKVQKHYLSALLLQGPALIKRKISSSYSVKQKERVEITNTNLPSELLCFEQDGEKTMDLVSLRSDPKVDVNRNRENALENKA
ncbi:golgi-body localization protein domain-containing protein [Sporodiniella umbellata]|nr:golgi-body localization protein domain-containing protein [Sporodiniella umbellata]